MILGISTVDMPCINNLRWLGSVLANDLVRLMLVGFPTKVPEDVSTPGLLVKEIYLEL